MDPNLTQTQGAPLFQLNVDMNANMALRGAASWAKVLAIIGFILGILFIIFGIIVQNAMSSGGYYGRNSGVMGSVGMVVYLLFGLITIISSVFALNFSNKITAALSTNDQTAFGAGLSAARNYFAFWTVICIIFALLFLLTFVSVLGK